MRELYILVSFSNTLHLQQRPDVRLEGGAAFEEASSSASLPRFRPPDRAPRLAEDMLNSGGELLYVSIMVLIHQYCFLGHSITSCGMCDVFGGAVWSGSVSSTPWTTEREAL